MKIEFNQNYTLDVSVTQVPDKPLYQLKLTQLDPMQPRYSQSHEYYFEPHQLNQLADYLSEVADGIN